MRRIFDLATTRHYSFIDLLIISFLVGLFDDGHYAYLAACFVVYVVAFAVLRLYNKRADRRTGMLGK